MGLLRLFLAISVLVTHLRYGRGIAGVSFLNGQLAVECFFVISGFYMALVLNEKYNYPGSYWTFIQQRFLRLYPLYVVIGIILLSVEGGLSWFAGQPLGIYKVWATAPPLNPFFTAYVTVINFVILGLDSLWFIHLDGTTGQLLFTPYSSPETIQGINFAVNGPAWTLSVELTFYLLAPFLVRKPVPFQMIFLLASLALRCAFFLSLSSKASEPWTYSFFPSVLFFFLAGSVGYHYYKKHRPALEKFTARHYWIFFVFAALVVDQRRLPFKDYFFYLFVPMSIVIVPLLFTYTRNIKWDRYIGELSYPFYLIHITVLVTAEHFLGEKYNSLIGPVSALGSLISACLLYQFIELRTERYREHLFRKKHPVPIA
jgi:peptidoglycan/LPS O-acetylase OafA/YrhL